MGAEDLQAEAVGEVTHRLVKGDDLALQLLEFRLALGVQLLSA